MVINEVYGTKNFMDDKTHRYYKHTKFHQNPRSDRKFVVNLTWNGPCRYMHISIHIRIIYIYIYISFSHFDLPQNFISCNVMVSLPSSIL